MKPWYRGREVRQLSKMFENAVAQNDALGAGAMFGCLFNLYQQAVQYNKERGGYRWRSVLGCLQKELDRIDRAAVAYPQNIQQAILTPVTFYREVKKAR